VNSVAFTSSLVAPYVTGWIKDWSGSFAGGCYLAALIRVAAVPVARAVGSPRSELTPASPRL
jgi:hypothetical protein